MVARFDVARTAATERQVAVHSTRNGIYLEFEGAPGHDLKIQGLESQSRGIRLMNVRTRGEGEAKTQLATVYVPRNRILHFMDKFQQYKTENTPLSNPERPTPKNKPLVASIEDVRAAFLTAFWTDLPDKMPEDEPCWVEVWLAVESVRSQAEEGLAQFQRAVAALDIPMGNVTQILKFPERWVFLIYANKAQLLALIDHADKIGEFRAARETCFYFVNEAENAEQAQWVEELLRRANFNPDSNISVCILDRGVNSGHPMVAPVLAAEDMHTLDDDWGKHDHDRHGHGTSMAGIAIYGDVQAVLEGNDTIDVPHRLEAVKILPPPEKGENPQNLWGARTAEGIYRVEVEASKRKRVICMAVTAQNTRDRGKPTSWSAALDQLASGSDIADAGDNGVRRLILVSAGNIQEPQDWKNYPVSNETNEIHDPAQSWNALSVGAYTNLTEIKHRDYQGYTPIAPPGGLCPSSTTSYTWPPKWPIKPDIVLEGGNYALSPGGDASDIDDLRILSLWHKPDEAHFAPFGDTSGATAHAAHLAARIYAEYPNIWPETVRGLLVHSARWTQTMEDQFKTGTGKSAYKKLLRTCGYGVPDLNFALRCLENRLTLVSEATLQPFAKDGSRYITKDLHLYELPWPVEELQELGAMQVQLRITLSYFVEPGPGEVGWKDRYRYASHGLRFDLNNPSETQDEFLRRVNAQAWSEELGAPDTAAPTQYWLLGSQQRDVGSIHSDVWVGTAAELANSNHIAIYPTIGWWRERHHLGQYDRLARYSLIVSIETPVESADIYTPVANEIKTLIESKAKTTVKIEIET